jgi:hypothetical protein
MSPTKLSLAGNYYYSPPGRVWSVTSRLGTVKSLIFFYSAETLLRLYFKTIIKYKDSYVFLFRLFTVSDDEKNLFLKAENNKSLSQAILRLFSVSNDEKNLFLEAEEITKSLAQAFSDELASALCIFPHCNDCIIASKVGKNSCKSSFDLPAPKWRIAWVRLLSSIARIPLSSSANKRKTCEKYYLGWMDFCGPHY